MPSITAVEQQVLDAIDRDTVAQQLADLIAVPSISGTDAEVDIQHTLAGQLEALGLDVDLWRLDLPALAAAPGYPGTEVDRGDGWGLVGTSAGEDGAAALVLQGHVDVVPPGDRDRWRAAPFAPTWRGTRVHGRGACDMKAGVVANLAAYAAIVRSGTRLRRKLALHLAIGEEDGGLGAFATLQRGHSGDACIITEPTSGTVVTGAAGALTFSVQLSGKATHASTRTPGTASLIPT